LQRETVRGLFDGSLFERLQEDHNNKKSSWMRWALHSPRKGWQYKTTRLPLVVFK
jgi:hypothetical protein